MSTISLDMMKQKMVQILRAVSLLGLVELRTATLSSIVIITSMVGILFLFFSVWLLLLAMAYVFLYHQHLLFYQIAVILIGLQLIMAVILFLMIRICSKNLLFPKMRQALDVLINS